MRFKEDAMEALKASLWLNGGDVELDEIDPAVLQQPSSSSLSPLEQQESSDSRDSATHQLQGWEKELAKQPDLVAAEGWQHFLAIRIEKETAMRVQWREKLGDHLHMAKALKRTGIIQRSQYYFSSTSKVVHGVFSFSKEAVSHPYCVHGGAQFFVMDECCGQLAFLALPGGALTASCDIKFVRPFPVHLVKCIVTAEVESIEGRKALLKGTLRDSHNGSIYTEIKALYVKAPDSNSAQLRKSSL